MQADFRFRPFAQAVINFIFKGFTCRHQTHKSHWGFEMCNWILRICTVHSANKCIEFGNNEQYLIDSNISMIYVDNLTDQQLLHCQFGESRFQPSRRSSQFLHKHDSMHFGSDPMCRCQSDYGRYTTSSRIGISGWNNKRGWHSGLVSS